MFYKLRKKKNSCIIMAWIVCRKSWCNILYYNPYSLLIKKHSVAVVAVDKIWLPLELCEVTESCMIQV